MFYIHIRDLVNMCMKKFHAEKNVFLTNLQGFELSHFSTTVLSKNGC